MVVNDNKLQFCESKAETGFACDAVRVAVKQIFRLWEYENSSVVCGTANKVLEVQETVKLQLNLMKMQHV